MNIKINAYNAENWKEITVKSSLPESIKKLEELARNIWWYWDAEAKDLFRKIDYNAWVEAQSNPVLLLNILSHDQLVELGENQEFIQTEQHLRKIFKIHQRSQKLINLPLPISAWNTD